MDLEQFLSRSSDSFSAGFDCRHPNQDLLEEVRDLARRGLKFFPVSLAAKLNGCPDRLIADATDIISLFEELSATARPLWGYRLAVGPSGVCILVLDGAVGRASLTALVPDLDECLTLQARCGDKAYALFRQPTGLKRIAFQKKLARGVSLLGDSESCIVPPFGGAVWVNAGAEIEALPYALRELLASENPNSPRDARCRRQSHLLAPLLVGQQRRTRSHAVACARVSRPVTEEAGRTDTAFTTGGSG